jgi:glycosyltransferase involved in cell wall biosynthesis
MDILIFNWRDIKNPTSGGAEILTHEMARRWIKGGHSVTQFSSRFPRSSSTEIIDGVHIIRGGNPDGRHFLRSVHFSAFLYYQRNFKGKFDVVVDEVHGLPFFTPLYVKEKKVVLICEVAGDIWNKMFGLIYGFLGQTTERIYLNHLYKNIPFLTISASSQQELVLHGVAKKNITVLPMGITLPEKLPVVKKETNPTLLFVGRLVKTKGVEDAILCAKYVADRFKNTQLWIIGRGDARYEAHLKEKASKLKINKQIKFFGFTSEKEKFELMRRAHILIHPSQQEGFGLTIPEAGIVGTPAVAYNVLGLRDIIKNGENGLLVNKNTPLGLAEEIVAILSDESYYKKLSRSAIEYSKKFNWDYTAKVALEILRK